MGRSTVVVKRGELRVNDPFRPDETSWSPVGAMIGDDSSTVAKPRRGPSLLFAITVIGGVALATAGAVSVFFMEPSEGEAIAQPVIAQDTPVETASLDPTFLPVRKVVTQHIRAVAEPQPTEQAAPTAAADDVAADPDSDALAPLDPRWARPATPTPEAAASVAATISPVSAAADPAADDTDPTDGTETGAIAPHEAALARVKQAADPGADATATDDPMSLVKTRPTRLSTAANMRSRPKSGSGIIMVVPQSATVQLVGCKVWCEIVYKGRRGFVYKDFLGGSRSASNSAKSKSSANKPKAVKTVDTSDAGDTADAAGLPGVETPKIKSTSTRLQ
jgi:SH3 domain-containing protein